MKRWWILGLLATIFIVLGAVLAITLGRQEPVGIGVGAVFVVVGLVMAWATVQMRREESLDEVTAPDASPRGVSWAEVGDRIRARFAGMPYVVETEGSVVRVRADLADATFLTRAAAHRVRELRGVEVSAIRAGQAITRDFSQGFEVDAGSGRLTGRAHMESGRSWSYTRRVEYGVGTDGSFGKQVDIDFASAQMQDPINEVLRETGWYTTWFGALPAESRGALVVGAIGGLGAIVAVVAVLVDALS